MKILVADAVDQKQLLASQIRKEMEKGPPFHHLITFIEKYQKLDMALTVSNTHTYLNTSYGRISVAAAIFLRNKLISSYTFQQALYEQENIRKKLLNEYYKGLRKLSEQLWQEEEETEVLECIEVMERAEKEKFIEELDIQIKFSHSSTYLEIE